MRRILWLAVCLLATPTLAAWSVTSVTTTDLGTLGGTNSSASDINESGQIVGWADNVSGRQNPFLFQNGTMTTLLTHLVNWDGSAEGINDSGVITGWINDPQLNDDATQGFRWINGVASWLNAGYNYSPDGFFGAVPTAINSAGIIAGYRIWPLYGIPETTVWQLGYPYQVIEDTLPEPHLVIHYGLDINTRRDVVGRDDMYQESILWRRVAPAWARIHVPMPPPMPNADFGSSSAVGINDLGHVVGWIYQNLSTGQSGKRCYFWNGASANSQLLGLLPNGRNCWAEDVNEGGFIVGGADTKHLTPPIFSPLNQRGFLYHKDLGMYALPAIAAVGLYGGCSAVALNERKSTGYLDIVGYCTGNNMTRAVRWTVKLVGVR